MANLSQVVQNHRLGLWILLLTLSVAILWFPTELRYEYQTIQSAHVFGDNLPLFGVLFCVWITILMLLLFASGRTDDWQNLALVSVFSAVFLGFWAIAAPDGNHFDEIWNLGHARYLNQVDGIPLGHANFAYFQFPALHIDVSSFSQVTGLGLLATRILFLVFSSVLTADFLYLFFVRTLQSPRAASLAVLLVIQGSLIAKFNVFWPGNLAFLLFLTLLVLLAIQTERPALGASRAIRIVTITLSVGFIASYAPTPLFFLAALAGIYLVQRVAGKTVVSMSVVLLFSVLFLAWELYWAIGIFGGLVGLLPNLAETLRNLAQGFTGVTGAAGGYIGADIPLWARLTRYSWLALIFGAGGIAGIWSLVRMRHLTSREVMMTGGLLGVTALGIVTFLANPAGQWVRLMVMVPLFSVPLMLRFLLDPRGRSELFDTSTLLVQQTGSSDSSGPRGNLTAHFSGSRRAVVVLLAIACLGLSLPTFLMRGDLFTTLTVYPYEHATGQFLESTYGDGAGIKLFSSYSAYMYTYYIPEVSIRVTSAPELMGEEGDLWVELNRLADDFHDSQDDRAILIVSERFRLPTGHPNGIKLDDSRWIEFVSGLAEDNRVFDNGRAEIYVRSDN